MPVCQYYLHGVCKFGNRCRNEHPGAYPDYGRGSNYGYYGNKYPPQYEEWDSRYKGSDYYQTGRGSSYYTNKYGPLNQEQDAAKITGQQSQTRFDWKDMCNTVVQEVNQWEKSGQWLLSTFAPFQNKDCYPGFEDLSPEEVRYHQYVANQEGNNKFYEFLQQAHLRNQNCRNDIKRMSKEASEVLQMLYSGKKPVEPDRKSTFSFAASSPAAQPASVFGGGSSNSSPQTLFGKPVFGGSSAQTSIFGGGTTTNVSPQSQTGFGASPQPGSGFTFSLNHLAEGNRSPQNVFGGNSVPAVAPSGAFGGFNQTTQVDINQTTQVNVNQTTQGIQPSQAMQPQPGFGSNSTTLFGKPVFGGFPSNNQSDLPTSTFGSGFGSNQSQQTGMSGLKVETTSSQNIYTPIDQLTDEEKSSFMAPTFTIGKIPLKPPPRELCF